MSVLVDERFGGTWDDLRAARATVALPLLAKGFFSTPEHLRQAREAGADAALLLLRDLDDATCARLLAEAEALGLDTLVEAHDAEEVRRAVALGAPVIGVNARDLSTFRIDRSAQLELLALVPRDRVLIAESGIAHRRAGGGRRARGRERRARRLDADARARPGRRAARDPAPSAREGLRPDPARTTSTPPSRQAPTSSASSWPRAARAAREARARRARHRAARRRLRRRDRADRRRPGAALRNATARHRARDAALLRDAERVGTVVDLPWLQDDPTHLDRARATEGRVMLAGGLGPENVAEAIAAVRPWAVDSARSTELEPGVKDHDKLRAWTAAAREAATHG